MKLPKFKRNLKNILMLNFLLQCVFFMFGPMKSNANPVMLFKSEVSNSRVTDFHDYFRMSPVGAKAAQASAEGSVVSNKPSLFVTTAVTTGALIASVRGDGGGTAGGLEKLLNPSGK